MLAMDFIELKERIRLDLCLGERQIEIYLKMVFVKTGKVFRLL